MFSFSKSGCYHSVCILPGLRGSHGVVLQREREREREIRDEIRLSIFESWRPPVMWKEAAMEEKEDRLGTTGQARGSFLGNGYVLPCNSEDS